MLKVSIQYARGGGREIPLLESLDRRIIKATAESIAKEYAGGAARADDPVLAALLHGELRQAVNVLRAAGMEVDDRNEDQDQA